MIRRVLFTRSSDLGHGRHFDRLEELIVRVTTWVALIFFVFLMVAALASGESQFFWEALNPATAAIVGGVMLARGSPRAIVQLAAGSGMLALTTGFLEVGSRSGALLGLLSMGIVAALLVRQRVVEFLAIAGFGLFAIAYWWNVGNWSSRQRVVESSIPMLSFVFAAGLIVWLKRELLQEGLRRRRAASALAASEQQFRAAFESSAAAMALIGVSDGRFLKVNKAGCEMLGYPEKDLTAMTIVEVTHPDDREASQARFAAVVAGEVKSYEGTLRYIRSDGSMAHGLVSSALVRDAAGNPAHVVAQVVDTSERHAAEQRLIDLLTSRDELIASVSHELRTPLTAVLGYAELLVEAAPHLPEEGYTEMVQEIVSQGSDLVAIIEDLLVFAQSDANSLKVTPVPVEMGTQVALVLESLSTQLDVGRVEVSGPAVGAVADPIRVRQVLRNLLSNAGRYGGDSIVVELEQDGPVVKVVVSDNGRGVPPADRERIFEPYHRSRPEDGLTAAIGVGLTVARRLARLMDGQLTYSYVEGRSRFELSLPASLVGALL